MKNSQKLFTALLAIVFVVAGVVTLAQLIATTKVIGILVGAAAIAQGLRHVWAYWTQRKKPSFRNTLVLVLGLVFVALGIFLLIYSRSAATIAIYLIAAWFVGDAISTMFSLSRLEGNMRTISLILCLLVLVLGLLLFLHTVLGMKQSQLTIPIGLAFLFDGLSILFTLLMRPEPENEPIKTADRERLPDPRDRRNL